MKKNKMCRLASALLILVLLTTSIVGSTFAKYTTEGTASDTARVAKWGVNVSATSGAFKTDYEPKITVAGITYSVSAETSAAAGDERKKLVAPGTKGDLLTATVTGTPEVAVTLSTSGTLILTDWAYVPDPTQPTMKETYCPIIITVDGTEYKMGVAKDESNHVYDTIDGLQTAVGTALTKTQNVSPNTDLSTTDFSPNASWKWNFADETTGAYQTDAKDTALGDAAADGNAPTIRLDYTVTVTQID